jgi:hypothetical protein
VLCTALDDVRDISIGETHSVRAIGHHRGEERVDSWHTNETTHALNRHGWPLASSGCPFYSQISAVPGTRNYGPDKRGAWKLGNMVTRSIDWCNGAMITPLSTGSSFFRQWPITENFASGKRLMQWRRRSTSSPGR